MLTKVSLYVILGNVSDNKLDVNMLTLQPSAFHCTVIQGHLNSVTKPKITFYIKTLTSFGRIGLGRTCKLPAHVYKYVLIHMS